VLGLGNDFADWSALESGFNRVTKNGVVIQERRKEPSAWITRLHVLAFLE
jgi:hypothetical protein